MNKVDEILEYVAEFGVNNRTNKIVPRVIKEAKKELCEELLHYLNYAPFETNNLDEYIKKFFGGKKGVANKAIGKTAILQYHRVVKEDSSIAEQSLEKQKKELERKDFNEKSSNRQDNSILPPR